jgi:hypothetical protein
MTRQFMLVFMRTCAAVLRFILLFYAMHTAVSAQETRDQADGNLDFVISVIPEAMRYVDLLEFPPYLAAALDNNGIRTSNSGRVIIRDRNTLEFKNSVVRFLKRNGERFFYEAAIEWDLAGTQASIKIPVEVDVKDIQKGSLAIHMRPPLAKYLPDALTDKIKLKIASLADESTQARMLDYVAKVAQRTGATQQLRTDRILEQILFDSHNLPMVSAGQCTGREPGDAEPLSDQWMLIAALGIWVVGPLFWITYRRVRQRRRAVGIKVSEASDADRR